MVEIINGNLFDTKADIIAHQVNCYGVMGSGVAAEMRRRFPAVFEKYKESCDMAPTNFLLGKIQIVKQENNFIVNMFSQKDFGYDGHRYTDYEAFYRCLEKINEDFIPELSIAFPYKIGCDRGGADWDIIFMMIQKVFQKRKVFIYKLEGK